MTTVTLTASAGTLTYGQTEILTATIASTAGAPSVGTVTLKDGSATLASGVAVNNGVATLQTNSLSPGFHALSAIYTGTGNYLGSQAGVGPSSIISAVAGIGSYAFNGDGGPAISAAVANPGGMAFDAAGNVFIADYGNNRIREVDHVTRKISTFAGTGAQGYSGDGGGATSAALNFPSGVAIDASGNLFIADAGNNRIRKVDQATGTITTIVGTGTGGYGGDGGAATAATLNNPYGVAVDASGNVFIADADNQCIRKVDHLTGKISTVAGNGNIGNGGDGGAATAATLSGPFGVAVDASGNVFIADCYNNRIRKVDNVTGQITTFAGNGSFAYGGDGGPATSATLAHPSAVAVDASGNVFVSDMDNMCIRKVDHVTGIITTVAGTGTGGYSGDGGPATSATLYIPAGVAIDTSGNVFIGDTYNQRVRMVAAGAGVTVAQAHLTVTAYDQSKTYGSANPSLTSSLTGFVNGDTAAIVSGSAALSTTATANSGAGSYQITVGLGTLSATNYDFPTLVNGILTVNPAHLTVTADDLSKIDGSANPPLTSSITGFVNGDTAAVVSGSAALSTTATTTSSPGDYPITVDVSLLQATNYTFTGAAGTLTVNPIGFFPTSGMVSYTAYGASKLLALNGLLSDPTSNYAASSLSVQTTNAGPNDRLKLAISNAGVQSVSGGAVATPLVITFTSTATRAQVQSALQNVAFYNVINRPSLADRTVQFTFTNGASVQSSRSATVHMIAAAFLTGVPTTVNSIARDPAVKLAPAAKLTDDNPNAFANSLLKVTNTNGGSSDVLGITAGGNLTVGAGTLSYTGIGLIGTFSGGVIKDPLLVAFNSGATPAAVHAVLQAVNISNSNPVATPFNRSISFEFIDGQGINSKVATPRTETVILVTRPSITGLVNTSYTLSTSPAQIQLAAAAVVNVPSGQTAGAVLSIQLLNGSGNDRLTIQAGAGVTTALVGGVNQVSVNGTQIGTYAFTGGASSNAPPNNLLLTMTFNGSATAGSIQAVLRNVAYYNVSASSSVYNRGVEFKLVDGTSPTPVSSKAIDTIIFVSH